MNKVVARFADGRLVKGTTTNFVPSRKTFHVSPVPAPAVPDPVVIHTQDLKALIFVKDYWGNPQHVERNSFESSRRPSGRPVRVTFKDGEVLVGTAIGYLPARPGFFLIPADDTSNIERCYVVVAATQEIHFL